MGLYTYKNDSDLSIEFARCYNDEPWNLSTDRKSVYRSNTIEVDFESMVDYNGPLRHRRRPFLILIGLNF